MKIEEQVLSIEEVNHLKEIGLKVENTSFCWVRPNEHTKWDESTDGSSSEYHVLLSGWALEYLFAEIIPTLTLTEILRMLPDELYNIPWTIGPNLDISNGGKYAIAYHQPEIDYVQEEDDIYRFEGDSLLECAYRMLCGVAEDPEDRFLINK